MKLSQRVAPSFLQTWLRACKPKPTFLENKMPRRNFALAFLIGTNMSKILFALGAILISTAALAVPLSSTDRYGETFVAYAQVDRTDGSYRRMLTTPDVLEATEAGLPLPGGARILMETYYSPGNLSTVFHKQKVDGQWQYGSFNGLGTINLATRPQASCLSCHARAAETDFTFTRPSLDAALTLGETRLTCDRGGRSPCDLQSFLAGIAE
ncbi:MAG: cytochrome P460 family protein [Pseudomonadota bacterium]